MVSCVTFCLYADNHNTFLRFNTSNNAVDQVKYDVMIPFTRQVSGPMDYTQGAMRNASKGNYYPCLLYTSLLYNWSIIVFNELGMLG